MRGAGWLTLARESDSGVTRWNDLGMAPFRDGALQRWHDREMDVAMSAIYRPRAMRTK